MRIIGCNIDETRFGMPLYDGGICLIENGEIRVAINEERTSRAKHAPGFHSSLQICLERLGYTIKDIDMIVLSNCCETPLGSDDLSRLPFDFGDTKVHFIPSHHLSHAYSAFMVSPFEEALIVIHDNEGNALDKRAGSQYWLNSLERSSYYIGRGSSIELIRRDASDPGVVGLGETYRRFTHYLGWPSYTYAERTMGLASYGKENPFPGAKLFELENGSYYSLLPMCDNDPIQSIKEWARSMNIDFPKPRFPKEPITQEHMNIARFVQEEFERVSIYIINSLIRETGIRNICVAGGAGLNSVTNMKILKKTRARDIFIQPAAGDSGTCLGNALYGYHHILGNNKRIDFRDVYLGFEYNEDEIINTLKQYNDKVEFTKFSSDDAFLDKVAYELSEGKVIGWFQGRSEFGPRALGNRSILADPRSPDMKNRINMHIKRRESFRPFAPSVIAEYASEYFELDRCSPYMLLVTSVKKSMRKIISAVTHVDGTARVQTVSKETNTLFYQLLMKFYKLTGVPILLNTSFNADGEPIVESPDDAVRSFINCNLDLLAIGNYIVYKK